MRICSLQDKAINVVMSFQLIRYSFDKKRLIIIFTVCDCLRSYLSRSAQYCFPKLTTSSIFNQNCLFDDRNEMLCILNAIV